VPTLILSGHCSEFTISDPAGVLPPPVLPDGFSTITLRLRRDVTVAASVTNPELYFVSRAQYGKTSFN
jgi:hypothetical protein